MLPFPGSTGREKLLISRRPMGADGEGHMGVSDPAIFSADAAIEARLVGPERDHILAARDRVELSTKLGDPEAVDHIIAAQDHVERLAGRHVENALAYPAVRVAECPLPLARSGEERQPFRMGACKQRLATKERKGHEGGERHERKDEAPADKDAPVGKAGLPACSQRVERGCNDPCQNDGRASEHHPPQVGDVRGRGPFRIQRGIVSAARGKAESGNGETPAGRLRCPRMTKLDEARHLGVGSKIALAGHPIHAMLVTFPIALVVGTVGADLFWWATADPFFARLGLWSSGWAFAMGVLAALAGTAELLAGAGIRRRPESWTHAVAAMMLLATVGANWGLRLYDSHSAIMPWGLLLSIGGLVFVGLAGWQGGKLVFEHQIGVMMAEDQDDEPGVRFPGPAAGRAR